MASASTDEIDSNKHKKVYNDIVYNYIVKKVIKKRLRNDLLDMMPAISAVQTVSLIY